jgi:hypothetical protein
MKPGRRIVFFVTFLLRMYAVNAQLPYCHIAGTITDGEGKPIYLANISAENNAFVAVTDEQGNYLLKLPANKNYAIQYTCVGFSPIQIQVNGKPGEEIELNLQLHETYKPIGEIRVSSQSDRSGNLTRINSKTLDAIPNPTGNLETLLKTLPGVYSNNELTAQYSVRGGNFDENLVYINDVEIYRPFLVRSGQQEGLSIINPDLVSGIQFSAGGFDASYGDKLSSVLDITYRQPTQGEASVSMSLLGGSVHMEGISKNQKLTHLSGFRYKTNQYLLNSLDTRGDYKPSFMDFQTLVNYKISDKFSVSFLGNASMNNYRFIPATRETEFGTVSTALKLKIYYDGQETDRYNTWIGALTGTYRPSENLHLKLIASGYIANEEETYDIQGQYLINELDTRMGSASFGDSIMNIGIGTFLDHARNFLQIRVFSLNLTGALDEGKCSIQWGLKFQHESINDQVSEWQMVDSAGYSLPHTSSMVNLFNAVHATNSIGPYRATSFIQGSREFNLSTGFLQMAAGIRMNYYSLNGEYFVNPRAWLQFTPVQFRDIHFRAAGGLYFQPPFYRELRNQFGILNTSLQSQKSIQTLAGIDYYFTAWNRPFKLTGEVYFKYLYDLVPYSIDNVRISYLALNDARGYSTGLDIKLNGEFVKGTDSWASISFMRSMEERTSIINDAEGNPIDKGFYPRPTDQLVNFGLFFQDYLPDNPSYRVNLYLLYGSGLPCNIPDWLRYDQFFRMPAYKRVDIGFSKVIKDADIEPRSKIWSVFREVMLSGEIFNLLGVNNTISYMWVRTVSNLHQTPAMFAVPNYLTARRFNLRLSLTF